ncbi:MAG TPA: phosphoesterase [Methanocorpusculum sp.]|nr:phosphoesterase [Methanocorpusculum sp.]
MKRTTKIVHLTHNDLDAAGCDAICRMVFGQEIITLFSSVNRFGWFIDLIGGCNGKGDRLIISDIGYQKGIEDKIRKIYAAGWKIEWYDHHRWTEEEKKRIHSFVESLIVDTSMCASSMIYTSLAKKNSAAAEIAQVVCDYDLWKHENPKSAILGMIAAKREYLELIRNKFLEGIIIDDEVSQIFTNIEQEKNKCMRKSIQHAKIFQGKYMIAVMPAYGYPSETAAEARKKLGCNMELLVFDTGKFSLRSVAPVSHIIARKFNGGGHPNASGGSFRYGWKERWMLKLFGHVTRAEKFVEVAETA